MECGIVFTEKRAGSNLGEFTPEITLIFKSLYTCNNEGTIKCSRCHEYRCKEHIHKCDNCDAIFCSGCMGATESYCGECD